jgi:hypothetical protein
MSKTDDLKGQCLCGAITISASSEDNSVGACHCKSCRRWGGGPFMEIDCGQAVTIDGEEHLSVFNSSDWAERGFCRNCGTHLFYRLKGSGQHMVPIGLFDDREDLAFGTQVFIDEKPAFYHFGNETNEMTGAEVFALFGGSD